MADRIVTVGRVRVETRGLVTRRHRLMHGEILLGELHLGLSTIYTAADGRQICMVRPSPWRREVRLMEGARVRASAQWRTLEPWIEIRSGETRYWLQQANRTAQTWELVENEPLLTIRRLEWHRAEILVHAPIDGDLLAFSYYLVVTRWRARHRQRVT